MQCRRKGDRGSGLHIFCIGYRWEPCCARWMAPLLLTPQTGCRGVYRRRRRRRRRRCVFILVVNCGVLCCSYRPTPREFSSTPQSHCVRAWYHCSCCSRTTTGRLSAKSRFRRSRFSAAKLRRRRASVTLSGWIGFTAGSTCTLPIIFCPAYRATVSFTTNHA